MSISKIYFRGHNTGEFPGVTVASCDYGDLEIKRSDEDIAGADGVVTSYTNGRHYKARQMTIVFNVKAAPTTVEGVMSSLREWLSAGAGELSDDFNTGWVWKNARFVSAHTDYIDMFRGCAQLTVKMTDETIQRRAKSATETMLRSQYDRNMKRGAKTCASAGLKTSIIRDAAPGCCKWCSDVAGRYTYGEEPKDVYRRHDNCSCTVVYESGRGRQNVWSKQYWSAEQEREYLRLRDEMAPKRLNAKQAQALREQVGGLTFGGNGGRINPGKAFRKEGDDPMFEVTGRAIDSNPREIEEMEKRLKEWGVEINRGQNTLAYGSPANGRPGTMSITDDASFSAWKHEFKHAEDDKNAGWNAVYVLWNDPAEHEKRERRAYEEEIKLAREAGREDIAKRLEANRDAEIERIWKAYRKYHGDT